MKALRRVLAVAVILVITGGAGSSATASEEASDDRTPARLSLAEGEVSFWRPGANEWAPAQINTALAPGDELSVGHRGHLELQIGGRAFVRAWGDTQLGLVDADSDLLRVKVTSGYVSTDVHALDAVRAVQLDVPGVAFTIAQPGYYRIDVTPGRTSFTVRRGGRATMTLSSGEAITIGADEAIALEGASPRVQRYAAVEVDAWDRWNEARSESVLSAVSTRYVPPQVAGVSDLDRHGDWRVVPTYGAVWFPRAVPIGWAPYSAGRWVLDPFYGWTWVDAAPWGWAPFHYGRWVFVGNGWAWAPGPIVARPVYAPALVAFLGPPRPVGAPFVSWVALCWGEPVVPWWGRPGFIGRPVWRGWGGPRVVNNVVVDRRTIINVDRITVYRNQSVRDAVVAVRRDDFARRRVTEARVDRRFDERALGPSRAPLRTDVSERSTARPDASHREGVATSPVPRSEAGTSGRPEAPRPRSTGPGAVTRSEAPSLTPAPPLPKATTSPPAPAPTTQPPQTIERSRPIDRPDRDERMRAPDRARTIERPSTMDQPSGTPRSRTFERPNEERPNAAEGRGVGERRPVPRPTPTETPTLNERGFSTERPNVSERPGAITRPNAINRQSAIDGSPVNERMSPNERARQTPAPRAQQPITTVHPLPAAQRVTPPTIPVFPGRQEATPGNAPRAERRAVDRESERGHRPGVPR